MLASGHIAESPLVDEVIGVHGKAGPEVLVGKGHPLLESPVEFLNRGDLHASHKSHGAALELERCGQSRHKARLMLREENGNGVRLYLGVVVPLVGCPVQKDEFSLGVFFLRLVDAGLELEPRCDYKAVTRIVEVPDLLEVCLLYTSPSPRDRG